MTIGDIAEELGLSKTTISRAISGKGRIGDGTRDKVLSYIDEHGYQPNLIARSLAISRTFNIAVALPTDTEVDEIPFFQTCLHSITETVTARDYDVILSMAAGQDMASLERLMRNRKVDGVILTRLLSGDRHVEFLRAAGIPFVVIGSSNDTSIIQIDSDHRGGYRKVMAHVLGNGWRKNVLLAGNSGHQVNKDRYAGYLDALDDAGEKADVYPVFWDMSGAARFDEVLSSVMKGKPDCIVCMDDVICGRALLWLQKKGYGITGDVGVVSFHDSVALEQHDPPVTALHINVRELGASAGTILLDCIEGKDVSRKTHVSDELLIRDSSRPK